MGLGYTLSEEVHFKGGQVLATGFSGYEIPRFSWLPKIEAVIVDAPEVPSQGGGEPAIVPLGAAVANAIYDLTGARLTRMPMTPMSRALHRCSRPSKSVEFHPGPAAATAVGFSRL